MCKQCSLPLFKHCRQCRGQGNYSILGILDCIQFISDQSKSCSGLMLSCSPASLLRQRYPLFHCHCMHRRPPIPPRSRNSTRSPFHPRETALLDARHRNLNTRRGRPQAQARRRGIHRGLLGLLRDYVVGILEERHTASGDL